MHQIKSNNGLGDAFEVLALIIIGHCAGKPQPKMLKRGKLNVAAKENDHPPFFLSLATESCR